jgi:SAM-dependent methyltransferase
MGPRKSPKSILKCSGLVLDFGCGHYKLESEKAKVIGLDYLPAQGADVLANFEFSRTLPFRSNVFDGAYLSHVLEHMRDPVALLTIFPSM